MLENYINGNLTDARTQAERFSKRRIAVELIEVYQFGINKAWRVAHFLKTGEGWQEACNA